MFGQFLEYEFGKTFKDSTNSFSLSIQGVSVDGEDNVYVYGFFKDTLNYEGVVLIADDNDTSPNNYFYAKFTNEGELIWMKHLQDYNQVSFFEVDDAGNIFFGYRITFQPSNILVKYDTNGDLVWEKISPQDSPQYSPLSIFEASKTGKSYTFGYQQNDEELENIIYPALDVYNGLLIQYLDDGGINQVIQFTSEEAFSCINLKPGDNGNIFVVIVQEGNLSINDVIYDKTLDNNEVVIYNLNESGEVLWRRVIYDTTKPTFFPNFGGLHYNPSNKNLLLTSRLLTDNSEVFGNNYSSTIAGNKFSLLISLNESGEENWIYQLESNEIDGVFIPFIPVTNSKSEIYLSSQYLKQIQYGEYINAVGTLGTSSSNNESGTAIMKFSESGVPLCLEDVDDGLYNFLSEIAIDGKDNIWFGGLIAGQLASQNGVIDGMGYYDDDLGFNSYSALLLKTTDIAFPHCEYSIDPDTFLCKNQPLELDAILDNKTYIWSNGTEEKITTLTGPGTYNVIAYDESCIYRDTINIEEKICTCDLEFPNAFTPNADGTNDIFTHIGDCEITDYHLVVYNRFGQKEFESRDQNIGWTGEGATADVYIWRLEISAREIDFVFSESFQGDVTLIR
jgi:gliding motility-associated-like protein